VCFAKCRYTAVLDFLIYARGGEKDKRGGALVCLPSSSYNSAIGAAKGDLKMNEPTPVPPSATILDQYKSYMVDVGNIGTRYTTSNSFYLSVITALLGILALTKAGEVFEGSRIYLGLAVSTFAVLLCVSWRRTITSYSKVFAIKFEVLRQMEQKGNLFPIFQREDELRKGESLLIKDRLIPTLLSVPFLVTLVFLLGKVFK
jgi:hypothetical protein